ncbi:MAG TPA: HEAT repeat domain-containing protein [Ktedonobacteraceae bacterium]|jgi:HEAT repeat protein|nr:HEAT repeat domain-containing protein [Ktedonobacteraceae bacterium]
MALVQFCPKCWAAANAIDATSCDRCNASFAQSEPIFYHRKLLWALQHPVPETRELAAMLLGQRRERQALPLLVSRLGEETDIGVLCAISKALGELGGCEAVDALARRLAQPHGLIVALTIVDVLASLAHQGCWEALEVLKAPHSSLKEWHKRLKTPLKNFSHCIIERVVRYR